MSSILARPRPRLRIALPSPDGRFGRGLRGVAGHPLWSNLPRAILAGGVVWLAIGLWIALVPMVKPQATNARAPGPALDDFGVFYSAALMVRHGQGSELYNLDALARQETQVYQRPANRDTSLPYFNPPAFAAALVPLTLLPVGTAALVFIAISAVLFAVAIAILWRASLVGYASAWLMLAMVMVFQSVQDTVFHGQVSFLLLFSFASTFFCFRRGQDKLGGFALGLLLLKPNLLLAPLAVLLWKRRRGALLGFAAMAAIWIAVSVAAAGPAVVWQYPAFLRQATLWDDQHAIGISGMFGWNALVRLFVGSGQQEKVLLWSGALSALTLAATLWSWRGPWNADERSMSTQFSALVICSVLINPHVYRQEMVLMFIPGFLLVGATDARRRIAMSALLFVAWALFLYHFPLLRSMGWNVSAPTMGVLLCVAVLMTLRRGARANAAGSPAWSPGGMPAFASAWASPASGAAVIGGRIPLAGAAPRTAVALPVPQAPRPLLSVVIPTRNERDNVEALAARLAGALAGVEFEAVFVDDSADDTPEIIAGLDAGFPVTLIHRQASERKGGLTTAILRGLRVARGQYVSVIDGDLQHPPEKLAEMLAEATRSGADVVVASRYRAGGSAAGLPGASRRLVSLGSKWISKVLFYERLRHTSDPGSGFFLLRREVIDGVELRPVGYKMLTEILVRGTWSTIAEVAYCFQPRERGASNAGFRQGLQYLHHTLRIFVEVPDVAHAWKFLTVGASGVVVNLGLLWAGSAWFGLSPHIAWGVAVEASVLSNFWWNHTFTWRDRRAHGLRGVAGEIARYHLASVAGVAANFAVFTAATMLGMPTLVAGTLGIAGGMAANFAGATRFVFRGHVGATHAAAAMTAPAAPAAPADEVAFQAETAEWEGWQPWL
ncbi:MAG TPA: glycosyltransferase [Dehalococcoidia bacterium]|nr:glycosyltransferase [Dehalococcoidia bacterium]